MEAARVDTFREACADLGVTLTTSTESDLRAALEAAIETPAVATPLPFDLNLEDLDGLNMHPTREELTAATTGVTSATLGVAESGSILLPSTPAGSEPISLYPEKHVAILRADALVEDLRTAFDRLEADLEAGGDVIIATGPSATADMGDLVVGAHGPRSVEIILVEES